jgi:hypothetical protein
VTGPRSERGRHVEAISVDAFVTDRTGNPVLHLQRDDFEVLEDGVPQVLSSFVEVKRPSVR